MYPAVNELFEDEIKAMKKEMKAKDNQIADLYALIEKLQAQLEKYAKNEG